MHAVIVTDGCGKCIHVRKFASKAQAEAYSDGIVWASENSHEGVFVLPGALESLRFGVDSESLAHGELERVLRELGVSP